MTQVNKAAVGVSVHEQHAEVSKFRESLEALMVTGKVFMGNPSLEDAQAVAFTTLTEDVLEPAGLEDELKKIDGVTDPASKVELIMQDIIQPQLTTVAQLEEHLAEKAESAEPFTTRDQMTAQSNQASFESLLVERDELRLFSHGLHSVKVMASCEGITPDMIRPIVSHFIRQVPDIAGKLSISVEDLEETQVLGDLTDAVDKMTQVVENARVVAETQVNDTRGANEVIESENSTDWTENLLAKVEETKKSGVEVNDGVKVSSTPSDGGTGAGDTNGQTGDADENLLAAGLDADGAAADADAVAAAAEAEADAGDALPDAEPPVDGVDPANAEQVEIDSDGNPVVKDKKEGEEEEQEEEEEEEV